MEQSNDIIVDEMTGFSITVDPYDCEIAGQNEVHSPMSPGSRPVSPGLPFSPDSGHVFRVTVDSRDGETRQARGVTFAKSPSVAGDEENFVDAYDSIYSQSPDPRQERSILPSNLLRNLKYPFVTWFLFLFTLLVFLTNVEDMNDTSSWFEVVPENSEWWFFTAAWWPDCESKRDEFWRPFSFQFVHSGINHLGGNMMGVIIYGSFFEIFHWYGHVWTFIIYELSILCGALGHSLLFPWTALVGCSPGVYGLFGATTALMVYAQLPISIQLCGASIFILMFAFDTVYYFKQYNDDVSYASHAFGFYTGFTLSCASAILYSKDSVKLKVVAAVGTAAFCLELTYLLHHYFEIWPPQPYTEKRLHNTDVSDACCPVLWETYELFKDTYSFDEIRDNSQCSNNNFYFDGAA